MQHYDRQLGRCRRPLGKTRCIYPYPDEANLVFLCRKMAAVPVSEDSFTDSTLMDKWYSDHDMHMMYVGEIVEVTAR